MKTSFRDATVMRSAQVIFIGTALLAMTACSSVKDELGLTKNAPDEFAVVTKAPLVMPPDYSLRPPQPGAPATRDPSPSEQARAALLGTTATAAPSQAEQDLLTKAGVDKADPDIRAKVAGENREISQKSQAFSDQVLFWQQTNAQPVTAQPVAADASMQAPPVQAPPVQNTGSALPGDPQGGQQLPAPQTQTATPQPAPLPQKEEEEGWLDWF
jgi:hypothetical protein